MTCLLLDFGSLITPLCHQVSWIRDGRLHADQGRIIDAILVARTGLTIVFLLDDTNWIEIPSTDSIRMFELTPQRMREAVDKSGIDGRHKRSRNYRLISLLNATRLSILISSIGLVHGTQEKTLTILNKRSLLMLLKLAFK